MDDTYQARANALVEKADEAEARGDREVSVPADDLVDVLGHATWLTPNEVITTVGRDDLVVTVKGYGNPEVWLIAHLWRVLEEAEDSAAKRRIVDWLSARVRSEMEEATDA